MRVIAGHGGGRSTGHVHAQVPVPSLNLQHTPVRGTPWNSSQIQHWIKYVGDSGSTGSCVYCPWMLNVCCDLNMNLPAYLMTVMLESLPLVEGNLFNVTALTLESERRERIEDLLTACRRAPQVRDFFKVVQGRRQPNEKVYVELKQVGGNLGNYLPCFYATSAVQDKFIDLLYDPGILLPSGVATGSVNGLSVSLGMLLEALCTTAFAILLCYRESFDIIHVHSFIDSCFS